MANFGYAIKDRKLATSDCQTKSGHWYADFGLFLVTNLSFSTSVMSMDYLACWCKNARKGIAITY